MDFSLSRETVPFLVWCLGILTLILSIISGIDTSRYRASAIGIVVGATAGTIAGVFCPSLFATAIGGSTGAFFGALFSSNRLRFLVGAVNGLIAGVAFALVVGIHGLMGEVTERLCYLTACIVTTEFLVMGLRMMITGK